MKYVYTKSVRATRSPMNPKQWCLDLECGHDLWLTSQRKPKVGARALCPKCNEAAKEGAKGDA